MIGYASYTHGVRNLRALQAAGWHLLVTPDTYRGAYRGDTPNWPCYCPAPYALDNGAWGAFKNNTPWDEYRFVRMVDDIGPWAKFIVVPDIVAGGMESLEFSAYWMPRLQWTKRLLLLAVQDGMKTTDVARYLSPAVGIFLGGTTEWKLRTMTQWGELAKATGCYYHVGRVNSQKRIRMCQYAGADSFDGTSCTRFSKNIPLLDSQRRQISMKEVQ